VQETAVRKDGKYMPSALETLSDPFYAVKQSTLLGLPYWLFITFLIVQQPE
jgi:hypothetical protein